MKNNKTIALILGSLCVMSTMSSCIISQAVEVFVRPAYPGPLPPSVIADSNGRPLNPKWLSIDTDTLPAPSRILGDIELATDGLPYGFTSEYSNIVISPYAPHNPLNYKNFNGGEKVWDPYTRKAFHIPRIHTIN